VIGEALGPYRIDSELGSGGMGRVYAGTLTRDAIGLREGDRVAVKIVHPHLMHEEGFFKRFLREAEIGRSVRHDNVVRTFDADTRMVDGKPVDELCPLPEELCRHIAVEVAAGLAAIHAAGVLHRDLKPENVLITSDHHVKVMDLGVARLADASVRLSQTGAFVGSLQYAAPECFREDLGPVDHRVDLHALGLLLHELATGDAPYAAQEMSECIRRLLEVTPRRIGDLNPQISPFFEEVVGTLLVKQPAGRPASADELRGILAAGEGGEWWRLRATAIREHTRRPLRRIRIARETAVYGRDDELSKLRAAFERAKSGHGQVVLLEGETGIGKSRLVDELVRGLVEDGEDLDFLFGAYPPGSAATVHGAFSTAYREYLGAEDLEAGLTTVLGERTPLVPAFAAVLRGDPAPDDTERLTAGAMATMFVRVTRAVARKRPAIVLIDDLHHAPQESHSVFSALAHGIADDRVLLIGTCRRVRGDDSLGTVTAITGIERVRLSRLGPRDLAAVLRDALKSRMLAGELNIQIAERTDGNPFFLFAFLDELRRKKRLVQTAEGAWNSSDTLEAIEVPESVRDLIRSRVAGLSDEQRDFAEVAACLGFRFDPTMVAEALGLPLLPALKLCGRIELQHGLIRAVGREYEFDHHQVQEVLYEGIFETLREQYHAALAKVLTDRLGGREPTPPEAHRLCVQLVRARDGAAMRQYFRAATRHLLQSYVQTDIVDLADRALALDPGDDPVWTVRALLTRSGSEHLLARAAERDTLAQARAIAERHDLRGHLASIVSREAYLDLVDGKVDTVIPRLEEALEFAEEDNDEGLQADVLRSLGTACNRMGKSEEAISYLHRAVARAQSLDDVDREAADTVNLGIAYSNAGDEERADELYMRAVELARRAGSRRWEANAYGNLGRRQFMTGHLDRALDYAEHFREVTHEVGDRRNELAAATMLAATFSACGALDEAERELIVAQRLAREVRTPYFESFALANLAELYEYRGDIERAAQQMQRAVEIRDRIGSRVQARFLDVDLASYRYQLGQVEQARELIQRVLDHADEHDEDELRSDALLLRAALFGEQTQQAVDAYAKVADGLDGNREIEAAYRMWKITGEHEHLEHALQRVMFRRDHAPPAYRENILENHALHRRVTTAAREAGLPLD
jgi:tetratricopeptide (TPR) repeat protein